MTGRDDTRPPPNTLGRHLIAEFYGCDHAVLDDEAVIKAAIEQAAVDVGATVVATASHKYAPQGVTATVLIAESHVSIHTWPEHGYAAVDIFTCGGLDPEPGFRGLAAALGAARCRVQQIVRGLDEHVARGDDLSPEDVVLFSSVAALQDLGGSGR
jgi:S-adenosylmethionine decarboxylase